MARSKNNIFIDTGFFIAWINSCDNFHAPALYCMEEAKKYNHALYTSVLVLSETYTHVLYHFGKDKARAFRLGFERLMPVIHCLHTTDETIRRIGVKLETHRALKLTFVDASNLVFLKTQKANEIWSTDADMGIEGARLPLLGD